MSATLELLDQVLRTTNASQMARRLGIHPSTLANARKRGRLSPTLAGAFAKQLGLDATLWIAIAALEAEPAGPTTDDLMATVRLQLLARSQKPGPDPESPFRQHPRRADERPVPRDKR